MASSSAGQSAQLPPASDAPIRGQPPASTATTGQQPPPSPAPPTGQQPPASATPPIAHQPPASSAPPAGQQSPASATLSNGGAEAFTFPAYLELLKEARRQNCRPAVVMHPELLTPTRCGYCRQLDDLGPTWSAIPKHKPDIHRAVVRFPSGLTCWSSCLADQVTVGEEGISREAAPLWAATLLDMVAYEGNSCLECAKVIYDKTQHLLQTRTGPQFIRHGPDLLCEPARECRDGDTPLHCAARSKGMRMICHLISLAGEEYGHEKAIQILRKSNSRMETPLHEAIRLDNKDMVELLMWVDPELAQFPVAGQGTSPLYLAISLRRDHIARMLYRASGTNLSYSGPDGRNALHAALLNPFSGMPKILLDWNKDLSKDKDQNGFTPLHFAVLFQSEPLICYIRFPNIWFPLAKLETWHILDANPSAAYQPNNYGSFPIHLAAGADKRIAIRILLRRCPGCMSLRDNQGRSFLHIAVQYKSLRVVRYACRESFFAPIMNARDNDGNTALHIAVEVGDLSIFCTLLGNQEVFVNLRNNKNQTPLDLAIIKIDGSYQWNPEGVIYRTLATAGGRPARLFINCLQKISIAIPKPNPEREEKVSAKLTDSTRTLGIGSVLIASVSFGTTFTIAGAIKAADNSNGGKTTLSDTWYFKAFMIANTLAFVCSTVATIGLMYSGIPMVELQIRWKQFQTSLNFAVSSLIWWAVAFAVGVYMVLAPVGRTTAIAISAITPTVAIFILMGKILKIAVIIPPLRARRGIIFCLSALWIEYFRY